MSKIEEMANPPTKNAGWALNVLGIHIGGTEMVQRKEMAVG